MELVKGGRGGKGEGETIPDDWEPGTGTAVNSRLVFHKPHLLSSTILSLS